jgi:hypothetical protein
VSGQVQVSPAITAHCVFDCLLSLQLPAAVGMLLNSPFLCWWPNNRLQLYANRASNVLCPPSMHASIVGGGGLAAKASSCSDGAGAICCLELMLQKANFT